MDGHGSVSGRHGNSDQSSDIVYCTPCITESTRVKPVGFCSNCKEHLCTNCIAVHRKLGATRDHTIIESEITESPVNTTALEKIICETHKNEEVKFYCQNHDDFGCGVCLFYEHRSCKVDYIPEVSSNFQETAEFQTLTKAVNELEVDNEKFQAELQSKQNSVTSAKNQTVEGLRKLGSELNDQIKREENTLLLEADDFEKQNLVKIHNSIDGCLEIRKQISNFKSDLKQWVNHPHKLFKVSKDISKSVKQLRSHLSDLKCNTNVQTCNFVSNESLSRIMEAESLLGVIKTENDADINKYVSILQMQPISCFDLTHPSDKAFPQITGISSIGSEKIVCADFGNSALKLVDVISGQITSVLCLSCAPCDVTFLENDLVALTLSDKKNVLIVSTNNGLICIKQIIITWKCNRVTYRDGKLYVCCYTPSTVKVIRLELAAVLKSDVDNTIIPSLHDSADCRIGQICNVPIPTTVKITGYGDLTSKEDIRLCLANQTEGKVLKVDTPFKENAFIVTFEKYQDALRTSRSKFQYRAQGHVLTSVLFYDCLDHSNSGLHISPEIPQPIVVTFLNEYVVRFLQNSPTYKERVTKCLKDVYGTPVWKKGKMETVLEIECSVEPGEFNAIEKITHWRENCLHSLSWTKSIVRGDIVLSAWMWENTMKELRMMNITDPEKVIVFPKKSSYTLIVVGEQSCVEDLTKTVKRINILKQ